MTTEPSDDDLLARAARGDAAAFARLVDRHRSRLMGLATRMTGSTAAAEDVVQEAFTRAWVQAPRWRPLGGGRTHGVSAWLARAVVNLTIDQGRRSARMGPLEAAPEPVDPAPAADSALIAAERGARLREAVAALPERQRVAVGLAYDVGLSNAQGAEAMAVSVGAFELLLVRARRTLRAALRDGEGGA